MSRFLHVVQALTADFGSFLTGIQAFCQRAQQAPGQNFAAKDGYSNENQDGTPNYFLHH